MGRSALALVGTIGLFLTTAQPQMAARAEDGKVPTLAELVGSYAYTGDREKDESAIKAKSDGATAGMSRIVLKRALPRLESSTRIPESLSITRGDGKATFKADDHVVIVPEDGSPATVLTPLGETADASFDVKTATLRQAVPKTGGEKTNKYRFDDTGQLMMQVRVTNSRLATPVAFTLRYARKSPTR